MGTKARIGAMLSRLARAQGADEAERLLVWLRLAIGLAVALPLASLAALAWLGYKDAAGDAQRVLDETAQAAQEHAARVLDRNDVVLQQMLRLLGDDGDAGIRAREAQLHDVAMTILARFPDIRSLSVWGSDGRLLVSTLLFPVPQAPQRIDWDYFRGQRGAEAVSLTRDLLVDPASGERLFRAAKQRSPAGARAAGEIELVFSPAPLNQALGRLTEGAHGLSVALLNVDGAIVGSWPASAPVMRLHGSSRLLHRMAAGEPGGSLAQGVFADGDRRFAAFRKVGEHPVFVAAVQDSAALLAAWQRQVLLLGAICLLVMLALVLASWLALRRTRREIEARRRLREESKQRQLAEESLRHAQRLDALGQLAGGLAHDFNNLLAVVATSAELLAKMVPGAAGRPELGAIRRAAHRGTRLTRRLLAFFRKQPPRPEVVPVGPALDDMLDVLRTTAGTGIALRVAVDADTPAIEVDPAELEIALINLVANARDAMRHAGRIDIRARRAQAGEGPYAHAPGYAVISVADSGEGMSPETLNRAFEPFFTTKPVGSGTGLGLSQVFGFCEQSAGSVKVTSELHIGTTVSMFLPVSATQPAAGAAPLGARLLLVQRAGDDFSSLTALLRDRGCVVTTARSMQDAERLVAALKSGFDAVLIFGSGAHVEEAALVSRLHQREPGLPVVLLSNPSQTAPREVIATLSKAISAHGPAPQMH